VIRLLVLVPKPTGISPGQRYRLEQWAPHLRSRHGIELHFDPFESPALTRLLYRPGHRLDKAAVLVRDTWRRRQALERASRYDAAVIYREMAMLGPAFYERLLVRKRVPMIVDFDDAIWMVGQGSINGIFSRLRFPGKTAAICRLSSAVTVGNAYLADWASQHNRRVTVVPTSIELGQYQLQSEPADAGDGRFIIAWSGSHSTLLHLETAREAIERLAARHAVTVRVICDRPPARPFRGVENVFVPWSEANEALEVGRCHVGIMPLPDDRFTRGKCGLKALQFMATGRPVIVSPVGVNRQIVVDGDNGLLASSVDQWLSAFDRLRSSPETRQRLGLAGRRTVEQRFASTIAADRFAGVVREAISCAAKGQPA
jgi:glycosyltransferase involved in cell wall biosynthesis